VEKSARLSVKPRPDGWRESERDLTRNFDRIQVRYTFIGSEPGVSLSPGEGVVTERRQESLLASREKSLI